MDKPTEKSGISKYRIDIIVIVSFLLLSVLILLVVNITKKDGAYAEVTQNGNFIARYSLDTDGTYTLNGGTNILTIKDGIAYMSYSSCPDHTCENTGKIKHVGETIVCLPNRLTITIVGTSDDSVDLVS